MKALKIVLIVLVNGGVVLLFVVAGSKSANKAFIIFEEQEQSVAGWLADAVNGNMKDCGLNLVDKKY